MTVRKEADSSVPTSTFTIPRQGKPPVIFNGRLYAWAETERDASRAGDLFNFHRINIYTREDGAAVVNVRFLTNWGKERRGELPYEHAEVVPSLGHVADALARHDPCQGLVGIPPGINLWEQRNSFNQKTIRMRYQEAVGELLASTPELFSATDPDPLADVSTGSGRDSLSGLLRKMASGGKLRVSLLVHDDERGLDGPSIATASHKEEVEISDIFWADDTLKIEVW